MSVQSIQAAQPNRNANVRTVIAAATGAVAGSASRYVLPTKNELSSIVNKDAVDTFVSSAATSARGANRSILKFGAVGAVIAAGISMLSNAVKKGKEETSDIYTKTGALIDAPDYAVEIMWYGE